MHGILLVRAYLPISCFCLMNHGAWFIILNQNETKVKHLYYKNHVLSKNKKRFDNDRPVHCTAYKGQLTSKCLFGVFNSPKKNRTKTIQLSSFCQILYRKHGSSSFSHTFNCVCFSLFLTFDYFLEFSNFFLSFIVCNFLVQTLQYILKKFKLFLALKSWKNHSEK